MSAADEDRFEVDLPELPALVEVASSGRVLSVSGTVVRAAVPDLCLGDLCRIERSSGALEAEVIGFERDAAVLMPFEPLVGVPAGARVVRSGTLPTVPCGDAVRGRVLDALGRPLDGRPLAADAPRAPLLQSPPNPLRRAPIRQPLATGVRAIDSVLTIGRGQRVGVFAAAGGGKSTLLSMLVRNVRADRIVVALIGERGWEVPAFKDEHLGAEGLARATLVVSTSDQSPLLRLRAAWAATAIAEEARSRGEHVVLLMDSVTRFARALREVGLALDEPPGRQGFPPSVFATLPRLFERAGNDDRGSITAFYTVLVAGDDLEEPVADETISLLDGHIILSRRIAERGRYPAIDVLRSKSRLMDVLVSPEQRAAARRLVSSLAIHEANYDKIQMGLYDPPNADEAALVRLHPAACAFLAQERNERPELAASVERLVREFKGK